MKIEVNIEKKYFFGLMIIGLVMLGVVGVVAYNSAAVGGNPAVFGHSVDEIDWTKIIQGNVSVNGTMNATKICLNNVCNIAWPSGGTGGGADTRCDTNGTCAQLCIGSDCRTSWSTGAGGGQWTTGTNGINYSGNVGIGVAADASNKLLVDGTFKVVGGYGTDTYGTWGNTNVGDIDSCPGSVEASAYECASVDLITSCSDVDTSQEPDKKRTVTCNKEANVEIKKEGIVMNGAVLISHVSGDSPHCVNGTALMRKWVRTTCTAPREPSAAFCGPVKCTISGIGWDISGPSSCKYYNDPVGTDDCDELKCTPDWTDVLCVGDA